MLALTALGSGLAVVPPIAAGPFIVSLLHPGDLPHVLGWGGLIAATSVLSAAAYGFSDGIRSTVSAGLYARLRVLMLDGALRAPSSSRDDEGVVSRFISDAEHVEMSTVAALDDLVVAALELLWCLAALTLLDPWSAPTVVVMLGVGAVVLRVAQRPLGDAGQARQERLQELSVALVSVFTRRGPRAPAVGAIGAAREADVRLGRLEAVNHHVSRALADLGPLVVVGLAALRGGLSFSVILSLLLVTERALHAAAELSDVAVDVETVRGAVIRCFEVVDGVTPAVTPAAADSRRRGR
jgi:ABC-type multidrug transport system fused ATPase/permease subunit